MLDGQGRNIDYLRISITDRCNLRCVYCMPEEGVKCLSHSEILTFDEIERIVRVMAERHGFKKIKLTGGEPLVRLGCAELAKRLKSIEGITDVTITTNGVTLERDMPALYDAGIRAVNVSLDTLDRDRFKELTRRDELDSVLGGIRKVMEYPDVTLKINCVPISGHDEDLVALASIAKHNPIHVRFIEVMPIGYGKRFKQKNEDDIIKVLEKHYGELTPDNGTYGNGPSHYFSAEGFLGKIGFISAISHKFCSSCNRIRLTSEGYLKTCLQYETGVDLREILRSGGDDDTLAAAIEKAILEKPICHSFFDEKNGPEEERGMSQIGG